MEKSTPEAAPPLESTEAAQPAAAQEENPGYDVKDYPPALVEFMLQGWRPKRSQKVPRVAHHKAYRARREALSARFPGEVLVVPTGHEKVRSNDTHYRFRPGSDFFYLTGNLEPDCVLVLEPLPTGGHRHVLFVEPNPGRADKTFFTNRLKGELWVGPRLGVAESRERYAVDEARGLPELKGFLEGLGGEGKPPVRVLRGFSDKVDLAVPAQAERDKELAQYLSEARLFKDKAELAELEVAIAATQRGFEDVIRRLKEARSEREVEGVFALRARMEGNDVGYGIIAASGHHACTLHWTRNDGELKQGELLLLDAGVEGHSLYTADITRTLPVSGRFSPEQREVYELVLAAQEAAIAAVKPGNDFMEPTRVAMRVLTEGLCRMGILKVPAEEALAEDKRLHKRYTLHNVSHMLGLDVHDCAQARQENYKYGKLKPGMVLTVEPGLYFQKDDLTVPARYRGIGVRIEDDVVVTAKGCRVLSASIPRTVKDVEAWMKRLWKEKRG